MRVYIRPRFSYGRCVNPLHTELANLEAYPQRIQIIGLHLSLYISTLIGCVARVQELSGSRMTVFFMALSGRVIECVCFTFDLGAS
jgi:hypothetical protein